VNNYVTAVGFEQQMYKCRRLQITGTVVESANIFLLLNFVIYFVLGM